MYFSVLEKKSILKILTLIVIGVVCSMILSGTGAYQVFYGYAIRELPIYRVETIEKKVAISFDCAWGVDYTDKLLEIMQEHNVKCTFFAVEFWTKKYPEYIKKIDDYGHEIGTHSASHPYMSKLSSENIVKELSSSSKAIQDITGKRVELFRAPYGDYNDRLIQTARTLNLYTIQWDVDSLDWKNLTKQKIASRVIQNVKNGSIVLFHNQGLHTAEALGDIIDTLHNRGYKFVCIGELIYKNNYKMLSDGTQVRCF